MSSLTPAGFGPSLQVGGRSFTDLSSLIHLVGSVGGATNGNTTLRKYSATTGYQVPAGKTLVVTAIRYSAQTAGGAYVCYADNDVLVNTNTAFTNQVYAGGSSSLANVGSSVANNTFVEKAVNMVFPALKYPAVTNAGGTTVGVIEYFGYEV